MRNKYQRKERKSNHKFEVVGGQELLVRVPLPIAEVWAEMQAQVEELTGQAGLQILRAILENEVTHRVGPPHRPNPRAGCVRWGKQPGYVVFAGQKIPLERPRVRTREGQEGLDVTRRRVLTPPVPGTVVATGLPCSCPSPVAGQSLGRSSQRRSTR